MVKTQNARNKIPRTIEAIIKKAVIEAIEAGRKLSEQKPKDAFKATERRLYALPDLREKVKRDRERLEELQEHGLRSRSNDIIRFQKSGRRISDEELLEGLIQDLKATIAADEYEIKTIEDALAPLTSDPYFRTVTGRYFDNLTDEEIAKEIPCDPATVWRNRGRLVTRLAVRLYGVDAL